MRQNTEADSGTALGDYHVIDSDFHLNPEPADVVPYIEDDRVRRKIDTAGFPESPTYWNGKYATPEGGTGLTTQGIARSGGDIHEVAKELGVDTVIVTPSGPLQGLPGASYPRLKSHLTRAYNDYLLDNVTNVDESIKAVAVIPQWDPEFAVEELDRIGSRDDIAGAYGWFNTRRLFGAPDYDPVYEKLVELDLPWALHASGSLAATDPWDQWLRSWSEAFGFSTPLAAIVNTTNMILTGVFDKFPELKILYQESGIQWIPFVANRLDEFYQDHPEDIQLSERMFDMGQQYLDRRPSEYVYDNFYFSTQPICGPRNQKHFAWLLKLCHAIDTFVFSTDWPHFTMDVPTWVTDNPRIESDVTQAILHENAEELFRL